MAKNFTVPSFEEVDPEGYGALVEKRVELNKQLAEKQREIRAIEVELAADKTPNMDPKVAALLGDAAVSARAEKRQMLQQLIRDISTINSALIVLRERTARAKDIAARAFKAAVEPEWRSRIVNLAEALAKADVAFKHLFALRLDVEANDGAPTMFGEFPHWLGDPREGTLIERFLNEVSNG